uniref:NPL domain-containing protein n=1 Tax=Ascaris lumbricoides TaxID=6252 RepID=A0A0M3I6W5_ASCLU
MERESREQWKKKRCVQFLVEKILATVVVERELMADSAEIEVAPSRREVCAVTVRGLKRRVSGILPEGELVEVLEEPRSEDDAFLHLEEVSISCIFTKQRTQKVGVGAIFNSEKACEEIELVENLERRIHECDTIAHVHYYASDHCVASILTGYEITDNVFNIVGPSIDEYSSVLLPDKPTFEIFASITECVLPAKLTIPVQAKRGRSPTGEIPLRCR